LGGPDLEINLTSADLMNFKKLLVLAVIVVFSTPVLATAPPIWRDAVGRGDSKLFGVGQFSGNVTGALGFSFPYNGVMYTSIRIGTNGGIVLANGGQTLATNIWQSDQFEASFSNAGNPRILAFSTGLDHALDNTGDGTTGVYLGLAVNVAYITWHRLAGDGDTTTALISGQIELRSDGTIIIGSNAEPGANFGTKLGNGIVVGVSDGLAVWPPGSVDYRSLSTADISGSTTNYQIWCRNGFVGSCFQQNGTDTHNDFDLDGRNIVFNPTGSGGFQISSTVKQGAAENSCAIDDGGGRSATAGGGGGGGGGSSTFALLALLLAFAGVRSVFETQFTRN
jgi:hypothetical protein